MAKTTDKTEEVKDAKKEQWLTYEDVEKKRSEGYEVVASKMENGAKLYKMEKQ